MSAIVNDMIGFYVPVALCATAIVAIIICVTELLRTQRLQRKRIRMEIDKMNENNRRNRKSCKDDKRHITEQKTSGNDGIFNITTRTIYVNPDRDPAIDEFFHALDDVFGDADNTLR